MLASEDRGIDGKIARSPARTKLKGIIRGTIFLLV
jgi:hypothetical protein